MRTKLKILAISDTHLGEDVSLLSYPQGCQHLWREMRNQFGYTLDPKDQIEIDELIMIGDIPDRALSSTAEIMTATTNFIQMLGSMAKIKKGVYIPGNHDHTMWTDYLKAKYGKHKNWGCTESSGEYILKGGTPQDLASSKDLLATFFGYPYGSSWLQIEQEKKLDFVISNPIYSTEVDGRTYVFTHGSHFKKEVTEPVSITAIKLLDVIDRFVDIEIESGCDVTKDCNCLENLEEKVAPFLDSLWVSSKNNPTSQPDRYWFLLKFLSSFDKVPRNLYENSRLFSFDDLKAGLADGRIRRLAGDDDSTMDKSIKRWYSYFLPQMMKYLTDHNLLRKGLTFVYGDTHTGGWGELSGISNGLEQPIRVYNTGGWIAHHNEGHPACHIFAVDNNDKEYMLDISYKDVYIGPDSLIELACRDAENNTINLLSNIPKGMIDLCNKLG